MNRWLLIGSLAGLMFAFTGCATCSKKGGCSTGGCGMTNSIGCGAGCNGGSCNGGSCHGGSCNGGMCGGGLAGSGLVGGGLAGGGLAGGMLGRAAGLAGCKACGGAGCGRPGCMPGALGWQSGGLDYSSHLQTGLLGHTAAQNLNNRQFTPGPATGQVAYPYYTHRGPRDFLLNNPPTIGR